MEWRLDADGDYFFRLAIHRLIENTDTMKERPSFADIFAMCGVATAIGGFTIPATFIVIEAFTSGPGILLTLFIAAGFGTMLAMFTALPVGIGLSVTVYWLLGHNPVYAAIIGFATAFIVFGLWFDLDGQYQFGIFPTPFFIYCCLIGAVAGWVGYRIVFGAGRCSNNFD